MLFTPFLGFGGEERGIHCMSCDKRHTHRRLGNKQTASSNGNCELDQALK